MNWKRPHLWIGVTSFVLVLSVALVDMGQTSPGPLATVHHREEGLADSGSCSECHGGWRRSMTNSCLECHEGIGGELEVRDGLHGMMEPKLAGKCAARPDGFTAEEWQQRRPDRRKAFSRASGLATGSKSPRSRITQAALQTRTWSALPLWSR